MTDIEIAHKCALKNISEIAAAAGIGEAYVEPYGRHKAKISLDLLREKAAAPDGKLILVTAITPTPAGEGKTTTTIGLADGSTPLRKTKMRRRTREPSLGPVFGVKGGAAGGGYAQVVPMEDINLHFTGDFHAIGARRTTCLPPCWTTTFSRATRWASIRAAITWQRCVDMNDRQLRHMCGRARRHASNGMPREDGFDITVASRGHGGALPCATTLSDLKAAAWRASSSAYTYDGAARYGARSQRRRAQ